MTDLQMTFTADEQSYLVSLLQEVLKNKRVEEHRTRTLSFREHLVKEEQLIMGLLGKLSTPE